MELNVERKEVVEAIVQWVERRIPNVSARLVNDYNIVGDIKIELTSWTSPTVTTLPEQDL